MSDENVEVDVLVVGAGVAGLAAAAALEDAGREVCVVEAADEPGGVMRTDQIGGYTVERGPNTVQIKAPLRQLLDARGLAGGLIAAAPVGRRRYLARGGRLELLPSGPLGFARTPLLSAAAKWRLLKEPFVARGSARGESVDEFISRRLGAEVSQHLVGAFLTGVYAGDERNLGAEAVFPSLVELERDHGSLVGGAVLAALTAAWRRRANAAPAAPVSPQGLRGSFSYTGGLGGLSAALAGSLKNPVRLSTCAAQLARDSARDSAGWSVECRAGDAALRVGARQVVVATNAPAAARLLRGAAPECAAGLAAIDYAPVASVALGVPPGALARPADGFGFLVPRSEGLRLLGCLFMSDLFPGRAPVGHSLLQCMLGGVLWPEAIDAPDQLLVACARDDLERLLGVKGELETVAVRRWRSAVPQPGREHPAKIAWLRSEVARQPGLALAGGYLQGVAVADAAASGLAAAASLA